MTDGPILNFSDSDLHVEDPFLWHSDGRFHLIIKDDFKNDSRGLTGEWGTGVYATSEDCVHWKIHPDPKAYSRTVTWEDGTRTEMCNLERPYLLFQDGVPTHLFAATGTGERAWHVIPLSKSMEWYLIPSNGKPYCGRKAVGIASRQKIKLLSFEDGRSLIRFSLVNDRT